MEAETDSWCYDILSHGMACHSMLCGVLPCHLLRLGPTLFYDSSSWNQTWYKHYQLCSKNNKNQTKSRDLLKEKHAIASTVSIIHPTTKQVTIPRLERRCCIRSVDRSGMNESILLCYLIVVFVQKVRIDSSRRISAPFPRKVYPRMGSFFSCALPKSCADECIHSFYLVLYGTQRSFASVSSLSGWTTSSSINIDMRVVLSRVYNRLGSRMYGTASLVGTVQNNLVHLRTVVCSSFTLAKWSEVHIILVSSAVFIVCMAFDRVWCAVVYSSDLYIFSIAAANKVDVGIFFSQSYRTLLLDSMQHEAWGRVRSQVEKSSQKCCNVEKLW